MIKKIVEGAAIGVGIVGVIALAIVIAWAGDVFTVDKDGALKFAVSDAGKITVGATESYVNLVIQNNAAAANNKVDITADVLTVEGIRLESVSVSADITVSGAGGLDTGSEAANTWYYVWVITNNTGASTNGLLSTSSTSPTLPSGYTKKRRVGAVRDNGSSNFLQFAQEGNKCLYSDVVAVTRILSGGVATSWTSVSAASFIPPTSRRGVIHIQSWAQAGVANVGLATRVRENGSTSAGGQVIANADSPAGGVTASGNVFSDVRVDQTQTIQYKIDTIPTSGGSSIDVLGYYDRI